MGIKEIALRLGSRILPFAIVLILAVVVACSNDECYDNKNSLPLAGFYSADSVPKSISIDSISIYGIGAPGDSVLQDSVRNLSQTYLPFRIDQEETAYVIQYLSGLPGALGIRDTIIFDYEIVPYFVSNACGAIYEYRMREIRCTHFLIDSVTCPKGVIDNQNIENLKIYFNVSVD
ncbi:MAG: hypothetical protein K2K95_05235 [Muribaculaceae bacterium]|nr:hypothetical protein [Muribaculaceae bacterium]